MCTLKITRNRFVLIIVHVSSSGAQNVSVIHTYSQWIFCMFALWADEGLISTLSQKVALQMTRDY